jgi:hypothetical protein
MIKESPIWHVDLLGQCDDYIYIMLENEMGISLEILPAREQIPVLTAEAPTRADWRAL